LVTNGEARDGQCPSPDFPFVYKPQPRKGETVKYALLIYGNSDVLASWSEEEWRRVNAGVAEVVAHPDVSGYLRLQGAATATTLRDEAGSSLLTDGPYVDSKDFLGGFILVEAENLDGAIAVAEELQALRMQGAIEIRPVNEEPLVRA
jgi:hypothetical protein